MPTKSYPITVAGSPANRLLKLTVTCDSVVDRTVNLIVVNGDLLNTLPYTFLYTGTNVATDIEIVNIIQSPVTVIFSDPLGLWVDDFKITAANTYTYDRLTAANILPKYQPLHNFYDDNGKDPEDDRNYNFPFTTTKLNLTEKSVVDLKLQPAYDASVNMIFSDDNNPIRIVNSRFSVSEDGTQAELIDRRARKDANTYSNDAFHQTELIPRAISIPTIEFNGLVAGGQLPGGGYRYFFKYATADGAETDIIEESRLVSVHDGSTTVNAVGSNGKPTTNAAVFTLTNLDQSYYGIVVYFTVSVGDVDSVDVAYRIDEPFIIENGGTCSILHTGYETKTLIDVATLSLTYSIISRSKTLDIVNNRLLVGNSDSLDVYSEDLAVAASKLTIAEGSFDILHHSEIDSVTTTANENNYSNPKFIYDKLGYWKGETYELGAVFVTDKGVTPVYPLQGIDNSEGKGILPYDKAALEGYNPDLLGGLYKGFASVGQNAMGVYRTQARTDLWTYEYSQLKFSGTNLTVDVASLVAAQADLESKGINLKGFFFVRRKRKKDAILQGLLVPTAAVPIETKFGSEYEISGFGNYCGVGLSSVAKGNVKMVPAPNGVMPFGVEQTTESTGANAVSTDFHIRGSILDYASLKTLAMYSPDIECAPAYYASIFNGNKIGVSCKRQVFYTTDVNSTTHAPLNINSLLYTKISGALMSVSPVTGDWSATTSYIDTGAIGAAPKGFSGVIDRNIYCNWGQQLDGISTGIIQGKITGGAGLLPYTPGGDVDQNISWRPGNALAYGRYLGLRLDGLNLQTALPDLNLTDSAPASLKNTNAYNSLVGWLGTTSGTQLGYVSTLYPSAAGTAIGGAAWEARYLSDEDSEYTAITRRYRVSDFVGVNAISSTVPIYGGDCYLGLSWKQVYHPLGIAEAPQSNDITAYKTTRRSLGLLPYGYAIPVPAQSNYNFNVRSQEEVDTRETKVYGTKRSFLPLKGKDSIRGNRQFETGAYNHGYSAEVSAFKQFRLNVNAPFYRFKYPNRIYASSASEESEFVNGFSNFKGLNFKDYNSNLGAITKLINLNNVLIAVFRDGIAQIGVDERSLMSQDTGGVFTDAAQVLSRSNVLNSDYGSSHLHGIDASNNFIYGVDFGRTKIWRTNGQALELISDLKIQNKLGSIAKELVALLSKPGTWIDVYCNFDSRKNDIYFVFTLVDPDIDPDTNITTARTLVYNETVQLWICETDDDRKFVFQSNQDRYAFPAITGKYNKLYKYQITNQVSTDPSIEVYGEYNKLYDTIYNMWYDYHVIDEQGLYKLYNNILVVGNNSLPSSITYTSDYNFLTTQALKPYTNVRYPMRDTGGTAVLATGTAGTQILTLDRAPAQIHATQRDLTYGDFISVIGADAHTTYRYVVISYNPNTLEIIVDKYLPIGGFVNKQLYYGYGNNYPMRLTDSSFEESFGAISCQFNNRTTRGMSATKLRGKWMRFRHLYEGTAPVYISGIVTNYGISLS